MNDEKAVAVAQSSDMLIRMAIDKDLDIDRLQKLIEMRNAEEERAAKRTFDEHFAAMQANAPEVPRNGVARDASGKELYRYALLGDMLKVYRPLLSAHGLSYYWTEESISEGKEKRTWCIISGHGHERQGSFDAPIADSTKFTNAVQQRGVAGSYGKRYSFAAAVGAQIDDDKDGLTFEQGVQYASEIEAIRNAKDEDALKAAYRAGMQKANRDADGKRLMAKMAGERRRELAAKPEDETPPPRVERSVEPDDALDQEEANIAREMEEQKDLF